MASVLITGSSRGIGYAIALRLARAGHTVFATMRNPEGSPALARQAESEGLPLHVHALDVSSDDSVRAAFEAIEREHGTVDVLVNNAGIGGSRGAVEEIDVDGFREVMETNYLGSIRCIKAVLPQMRKRGSGLVINISSIAGRLAFSPLGAYSASKFALEALSEVLAQEVAAFGIRVAIVQPGVIDTDMPRLLLEDSESIYPHERRVASMFAAALSQETPPDVVAEAVQEVVEGRDTRLRVPAGPDAEGMLGWRQAVDDEQWVAWWGIADDDAWYDAVDRDLGMDIRPQA